MPDRWIRRAAEWRWLVGESWLVLVLMVAAWWGLAMWVGRGDAVMVIWDLTEGVRETSRRRSRGPPARRTQRRRRRPQPRRINPVPFYG